MDQQQESPRTSVRRRDAIKKALRFGGAAYVAPSILATAVPAMRAAAVTGPGAPTVGAVTPGSGPTGGGSLITITGTGFLPGSTVTIGGNPATGVTVVNPTTITAITPPGNAGAVPVTVTNGNGSGTLPGGFTYTTGGAAAPTVGTVTPGSGPTAGGTPITITGTGFTPGSTVTIGGTPATGVTVVNPTTITATTPPGTPGSVPVSVTNGNGTGTLPNGFTYRTVTPSGEAYTANSSVLGLVNVSRVGDQTLPPGGTTSVASVSVPAVLTTGVGTNSAQNISATTPGSVTAQSNATVANVNLLAGALTATSLSAQTTSTSNGVTASSTPVFSGIVTINGMNYNLATIGANVNVSIPGVANVVLNRVVTNTAGANSSQTVTAVYAQLLGVLLNGVTLEIATAISGVTTT